MLQPHVLIKTQLFQLMLRLIVMSSLQPSCLMGESLAGNVATALVPNRKGAYGHEGDACVRTRHEGPGVVAPVAAAHQRHVVREHAADVGAGARGGHARHFVQRLRQA